MRARRLAWFEAPPDLDPTRLVFIDETGATTRMARLRGRSPRGQRCRAAVPHGHWKTTTLVAGLRLDGMTAPMVIGGAMNGEAFAAYAEHLLAPTLAPGDIVVMDNLPDHRVKGAREAIEQAFAKLKALPRKTAARTVEALEAAIAVALDALTPAECANYFTNSGYEPD